METTVLAVRRRSGVVLDSRDGHDEPPYRVLRWDDGHESVYFPGPDAHVIDSAPDR